MSSPLGRRLMFATLYFCEGAPIGLVWWALPAYWANRDVPVETVTLIIAVTVVPWSFKWLWAPLVDLTAPRWSYRRWIVGAQVLMGFSLAGLPWLDPQTNFLGLLALLVVHATSAATQDVAIDGMCVATVEEHERGQINGWMQAGMLIGRALFGGGTLVLAAYATLAAAVAVLVGVLWTVALCLAVWPQSAGANSVPRAPPEPESPDANPAIPPGSRWAFLNDRRVWLALVFALTAGTAFESVGALLGPFLGESGLTLHNLGLFQLGPLAGAMAVGALLGGWFADRFGHVRVAWLSLLLLIGLNVLLGSVDGTALSLGVIVVEYAVIGVFTASSYALLMDIASGGLKATVFSAYMGATNACEAASALAAGRLAATLGFSRAFTMMAAPSLLGLAILPLLRKKA